MTAYPNLMSASRPIRMNNDLQSAWTLQNKGQLVSGPNVGDCRSSAVEEVLFQINCSGQWIFLSNSWPAISGFTVSECLGQLFLDFFNASDRQTITRNFQNLITGHRASFHSSTKLLIKGGVPVSVQINACTLLDREHAIIGITGTISAQNQVVQDLGSLNFNKDWDSYLNSFFQSLPFAAGVIELSNSRAIFRCANQAAEELFMQSLKMGTGAFKQKPELASEYLYRLQQKCKYSRSSNLCIQFEYQHSRGNEVACLLHTILPLPSSPNEQALFSFIVEDVSSDREKLRYLAASESRYRSIVEALTEYVHCCSPDYTFTFANKAYCNFRKKKADELVGSGIFDDISPEDRTEVRDHFDSLTLENPIAVGENRTISPEGQVKWHQWVDRAIFNDKGELTEIQSVGRDITKRKMAEESLRVLNLELGERTRELQQSLRFEGILKRIIDKVRDSLDERQILQAVVQELGRALGAAYCKTELYINGEVSSDSQFAYSSSSSLIRWTQSEIPEFPRIRAQVLEGISGCFCWVQELSSGHHIQSRYSALVCPIVDDSGVLGSLLILKMANRTYETAELRLLEKVATHCAIAIRQARLFQEAQAQVKELERLNVLKDDFLSTVSHELRTPITSMKMAIRMLRVARSEEKRQQYLEALESECQREANLVNDLLDLQRLQSGASPLVMSDIKLQAWIPYITQSFIPRIHQRNQDLYIDIDATFAPLRTDEPSLQRILAELLNNACKYTPNGGSISITARASDRNSALISVSNSGADIPKKEMERIFEKFYRIPSGDRWEQGGTGLGLALVLQLVEHLGGEIEVSSQNKQVTFSVRIPNSSDG